MNFKLRSIILLTFALQIYASSNAAETCALTPRGIEFNNHCECVVDQVKNRKTECYWLKPGEKPPLPAQNGENSTMYQGLTSKGASGTKDNVDSDGNPRKTINKGNSSSSINPPGPPMTDFKK